MVDTDDMHPDVPEEEVAEATPQRSAGKRALKWIAITLLTILALIGIGFAVLTSPIGKRFIADQIAQVAPASGLRFEVGRIDGDIFGEAVLHDVSVFDPKGVFLTIPVVELDWRPLAWLSSGLDVRQLVLRRGTLLRLPELLPGDPDAPILPDFDIRVDRLEIDNLTLAPRLMGGKARRVNLLAKADIRDGRVMVTADGDLGARDTMALLVDARPDDNVFDLKLDYDAPRGGVLAQMLGVNTAYRWKVGGQGNWRKWRGAMVLQRDGERLAAFRLTNTQGRYGVLGKADASAFLSGLPARVLGDDVALSLSGTLKDSVADGRFALRGAGVTGRGTGGIDFAGNRLDGLTIAADLTDPELFGADLRLEQTNLTATLNGPFRNLSIRHELAIGRLVSGTIKLANIRQEGTAKFDGTRWTLPLDTQIARVTSGNATIDPRLVSGRIGGTVMLSGNRATSDQLRADFPGLSAQLSLRGRIDQAAYALAGPVAIEGLQLDNLGTVGGNAKIVFQTARGTPWRLSANLAGRMSQVSNATLANLAGAPIRFRGGVTLSRGGPIAFRDASLTAPKITLAMDGRVVGGNTTLTGRGRHVDYGPFTVEASLGRAGPEAVLVFADPFPSAGLKDVRVALSPIADGFRLVTNGDSLLGTFDGDLNLFAPRGGPTRIVIERLDIWKTAVTGNLTLGQGGATGSLALVGGGLDGKIDLTARNGGQGFAITIDADDARFGGDTPISIGRADIRAQGFLTEGNSTIRGNAFAQGITYGNLFVGRLAATAALTNGRGDVTAQLAGRRGSRFNLQVNAQVAPERIAAVARGDFGGRTISMPRRAVLLKDAEKGWNLQPTQISYGGGIAIAEGRFRSAGATDLNLKLSKMPLSLLDIVVRDLGVGGTISGLVDIRTARGGAPVADARVTVDDLSRSGLVLSSRPIDLAMVLKLTENRLETRAVISEGGERRGRLQGRITGLPQSGELMDRLRAGNLFAQLRYQGPAAALWRLAAVEAFDMTGPVSIATNVSRNLRNPLVRGSLASDNLRVRSAISGTDIRNIKARGSFAGSRLRLTSFAGKTPNGGTVTGSGTVNLANLGQRGPALDIRASAKNARLLDGPGIGATVTGPLRIISDGIGGTIAGRVRIDRAKWSLGQAEAEAKLPRIRTTEINVPRDIAPSTRRRAPWRYLIDASGNDRIDVDGLGLDSEWRADIVLRGTTDDPRIGGEARVVQGRYSFAGTRFELERGRIDFDENAPIDPSLDILATTERDGLTVNARVIGTAQQPEIAFSSIPALPEEELLARLLFGGSITQLSATDALQLGTALASLRGGGGLDPINQLRAAIGLDRLRIVSADPALGRGTGVALGKNFGRRTYVEIITDGRGYSATEVEFRVTSWLSLLASISTVGRESAVIEASRDY